LGPESTVPMHPQLRPFTRQIFLDFGAIFPPEWPLNFFCHHNSPSNLAESWYPRWRCGLNPVKTPVRIRNQNDQIWVRIYLFCSDSEQESEQNWDLAVKYLGSLSEKRKGFLLRICVFVRRFGDEVSVMVEGAGCWTDETEKPGFSNAQLFVAYILMMMIACITFKSSLVPLFEGL